MNSPAAAGLCTTPRLDRFRRSIPRHEVLVDYDDVVGVVVDRYKTKGAEAGADRRNADAERTALSRIDIKL